MILIKFEYFLTKLVKKLYKSALYMVFLTMLNQFILTLSSYRMLE